VSLLLLADLHRVLRLAQEDVGVAQVTRLSSRERPALGEPRDGRESLGSPNHGQPLASPELQDLDEVLDIPDPAAALLEVQLPLAAAMAEVFLLELQPAELGQIRLIEPPRVYEGVCRGDESRAKLRVAGHRPRLDERLPLPRATVGLVVDPTALQRPHQGTGLALGPQPRVRAEEHPLLHGLRHEGQHVPRQPIEVVQCRRRARAIGEPRSAADEHHVHIARVVEFLAAELAEPQDGQGDLLAVLIARRAQGGRQFLPRQLQAALQAHVRQVTDRPHDSVEAQPAQQIRRADPKQRPLPQTPKRVQLRAPRWHEPTRLPGRCKEFLSGRGLAVGHPQHVYQLRARHEHVGEHLGVAEHTQEVVTEVRAADEVGGQAEQVLPRVGEVREVGEGAIGIGALGERRYEHLQEGEEVGRRIIPGQAL